MDRKAKYNLQYAKEKFKRIPLDVQLSFYNDILKPACDSCGLPVNTFIKQAITEKIERLSQNEENE